jgi:TonB family protein
VKVHAIDVCFVSLSCLSLLGNASLAVAQASAGQVSTSVAPPEVVQKTEAPYPEQALAARQESNVTLFVTVGVEGAVTDVSVAESGGELFDQAAMNAVKQWRFKPAQRGGVAIASHIRVPFRFVLPPAEALAAPAPAQPEAPTQPSGETATPSASITGSAPAPSAPPLPAEAPAPSAPSVQAQRATPAEPAQPPVAEPPDQFEAHGRTHRPSRGTSDFQLDVEGLSAVPRQGAAELLKLAPGVLLTNEGGEAHAEQIFLRGFDAREGQDLELTANGVPINEVGNLHGNGYADTHFVIPELVSSLRVMEGPYDPQQGNFAVAGGADYELGLAQRGLTLKQTLGSFGTTRTLLLWGPEETRNGTFAGAELYQTDGFGQNRDGRRASVMTQYEAETGQHRYRLGATAYIASFHSAGVLREDDYEQGRVGFFDTYDPRQGEDASRYSLNADLESRFGKLVVRNQVFGIARPMRIRENFTGFLLDVQEPSQQPHGQRGDLLDLASTASTVGARGSAHSLGNALGQPQELEVGYFARGDFVHGTQQRIEDSTGHPYHLDTDLDSRLGDIGLYADLNLRATSWLSARGGVRADLFTYDVHNLCAVPSVAHPSRTNPPGDQSCLSQQDFGAYREPDQHVSTVGAAETPHVTLLLGPIDGFGLSASYGRGVRSIDPIYVTQDAKTPFASATAFETGVFADQQLDKIHFAARSTLFQTRVDRDLLFSEIAGRNLLGGATTRTGSANSVRVSGPFFDIATNATYVHAVFQDTGHLIPYIPDFVFRLDGRLLDDQLFPKLSPDGRPFRGTFATGISYVAPRPLPQGERGNPIFTVDLNATLGWALFELGFACTNLFDSRYRLGEYNYTSDFHNDASLTLVPVRHFSAGAPRAFFVTLAVHLGSKS